MPSIYTKGERSRFRDILNASVSKSGTVDAVTAGAGAARVTNKSYDPIRRGAINKIWNPVSAKVTTMNPGFAGRIASLIPGLPRLASRVKAGLGGFQSGMSATGKFLINSKYTTIPGIAASIAFFGTAAFLNTTGNMIWKNVRFRSIDKPSALRQGPGYISWGKTSGMPANHLSTDGLSLSLSNLRHTSVI